MEALPINQDKKLGLHKKDWNSIEVLIQKKVTREYQYQFKKAKHL
jgi:hypothetical protein